MNRNGPIVILGGYGQAGHALAAMLLEHFISPIVIAGRRVDKAENLARQLDASSQRIQVCYADASKPETLRAAFQGASLAIVTAAASRYVTNIAQACLDTGCDYFDILETADVLEALQNMDTEVTKANRLFVTQGGLTPGLQSAFVYLASHKLDRCRSIRIGHALGFKTMERPEQVTDIFKFALSNKPRIFKEGGWRERPFGEDRIKMDFGPCHGIRPAILLEMAEMRGIPEQLGLEGLAFYGAVPSLLFAFPVDTLLATFNGLKGSTVWNGLAGVILWSSKHLMRERCAYSIVVEASGRHHDREQAVRIVLEHEDNYFSTAAAVIAFLNQYRAGNFSRLSGVKVMGHIIDPEKAVRDVEAFGLHVMITQSDA